MQIFTDLNISVLNIRLEANLVNIDFIHFRKITKGISNAGEDISDI